MNIDPNFGFFLLIIQFPMKLPWMFHQCFLLQLTSYLYNLAWFSSSQTCHVYWLSIENNKIWHYKDRGDLIMNVIFKKKKHATIKTKPNNCPNIDIKSELVLLDGVEANEFFFLNKPYLNASLLIIFKCNNLVVINRTRFQLVPCYLSGTN